MTQRPGQRTPGLLTVWNDIGEADLAAFNAWYEEEHAEERLALPGVLSARRYADIDRPLGFAAVYDLESCAALNSPAYLERLANPTERTRAIMPRFRNMVRTVSEVEFDAGAKGAHALLACIELDDGTDAAAARTRVEAEAPKLVAATNAPLRIRFAVPSASATHVPNPEARLRAAPDRIASPFVFVEAGTREALDAALGSLTHALGARRPPRIRKLLSAREKRG